MSYYPPYDQPPAQSGDQTSRRTQYAQQNPPPSSQIRNPQTFYQQYAPPHPAYPYAASATAGGGGAYNPYLYHPPSQPPPHPPPLPPPQPTSPPPKRKAQPTYPGYAASAAPSQPKSYVMPDANAYFGQPNPYGAAPQGGEQVLPPYMPMPLGSPGLPPGSVYGPPMGGTPNDMAAAAYWQAQAQQYRPLPQPPPPPPPPPSQVQSTRTYNLSNKGPDPYMPVEDVLPKPPATAPKVDVKLDSTDFGSFPENYLNNANNSTSPMAFPEPDEFIMNNGRFSRAVEVIREDTSDTASIMEESQNSNPTTPNDSSTDPCSKVFAEDPPKILFPSPTSYSKPLPSVGAATTKHSSLGGGGDAQHVHKTNLSIDTHALAQHDVSITSQSSVTSTTTSKTRASSLTQDDLKILGTASSTKRSAVVIYPALLSRVAEVFKEKIVLQTLFKDQLEYRNCFTGKDAVDLLSLIIKTTDRNLALLLGRALDAQRFFHDVTYEHRLRDSTNELYVFRNQKPRGSIEEAPTAAGDSDEDDKSPQSNYALSRIHSIMAARKVIEDNLPNGVFTLLADCYSPTCTRDQLCYSISCPRRLEQMARLNMTPTGTLRRSDSAASLNKPSEDSQYWVNTVSKEIVDTLSDKEKKAQEIIYELIYTEKDFVKDLDILQRIFIEPLRFSVVIPDEGERDRFIHEVFYNVASIREINAQLLRELQRRQEEQPVVERVGDVILPFLTKFEPFVWYAGHQPYSKYFLDMEVASNPQLDAFLKDRERMPETRRLPIQSFLGRPYTRLARYPLLLEAVRKCRPDDHIDHGDLTSCVEKIKALLSRINEEIKTTDDRIELIRLNDTLEGRMVDIQALNLMDKDRQIIYKGPLSRNGKVDQPDSQVYLLDHMLLITKKKRGRELTDEFKIHKCPIPLEMLAFSSTSLLESPGRHSTSFAPLTMQNAPTSRYPVSENNNRQFPLTIIHLGRHGTTHVLYAVTPVERTKWREKIEKQREIITANRKIFDMQLLSDKHFTVQNRVNCSTVYLTNRIVYGTDDGIYTQHGNDPRSMVRVMDGEKIVNIDILEEYNMLLIQSDKHRTLVTYSLDILDPCHGHATNRKGTKLSANVSFFKTGVCLNRTLICVVKANGFTSTIKTMEPVMANENKRRGFHLGLLTGKSDAAKPYKEFYIPTESHSIHFLRTKLCVGCTKGYEIVDLQTLNTQGLLDPEDETLNFVLKQENVRPISIFRIKNSDFLLCYDEFAFYVNKNGRRARSNWIIQWEGQPTSFALVHPYILAFDSSFIEVRHIDTGKLEQVIPAPGLKSLCTMSDNVIFAMDGGNDYQRVYKLTVSPSHQSLTSPQSSRPDSIASNVTRTSNLKSPLNF